ncbi:MAG: ABC transporter ATP-binding protein [Chloroflexi bacterium]|nr:ABC transporter ATP-binding protein [Chloroflexota bacterium]
MASLRSPDLPRQGSPLGEVVVEARALRKTYTSGSLSVEALRGVSLSIERGELVAIAGSSGCGKSTLLHCLSGLDAFDGGDVWLAGVSLRGMSERRKNELRVRKTGFVFQSYHLLPILTARENVELPLQLAGRSAGESRRRALELLALVGLADRADHLPSQLSGGQQQRVAIARALANSPDVIWADEPTGNLDSETADEVFRLLLRLQREQHQTLVIVTHDEQIARQVDRILFMRDGLVVDESLGAGDPGQTRQTRRP